MGADVVLHFVPHEPHRVDVDMDADMGKDMDANMGENMDDNKDDSMGDNTDDNTGDNHDADKDCSAAHAFVCRVHLGSS